MPILNPVTGQAAQGAVEVSVDGAVPAAVSGAITGNPHWLNGTNEQLIYQRSDNPGPFYLQSLELPSTTATESTSGANEIGAGGDVWAAWLGGDGLRTNIPGWTTLPDAGLAEVSEAGLVGAIQDRAEGRGLVIYDTDGDRIAAWEVQFTNPIVRVRGDLVSYQDADGWHLRRISTRGIVPLAQRTEPINWLTPCVVGSRTLVMERADQTLSVRVATQAQGYLVANAPPTFNPDIIAHPSEANTVRLAWATSSGEAADTLVVADLNLQTGAFTVATVVGGMLVWGPVTTLEIVPLPATPFSGGLLSIDYLRRQAIVEQAPRFGWMTRAFSEYLRRLSGAVAAGTNLETGVNGILQDENGGTGVTTGLTELNADNLTAGTVPHARKWTEATTTATGTVNNSGYGLADYLRAANASAVTFTGFVAGVPGQRLVVQATDADVTFNHEDGGSVAANRIHTFDGSNLTLAVDEAALLEYDGTDARWRLIFVSSATPDPENEFGIVAVAGQSDVVADQPEDTLTLVAGTNITLTTNPGAKSVEIAASGGGGSGWAPMTDGAEPPTLISNGAGQIVMVPYVP